MEFYKGFFISDYIKEASEKALEMCREKFDEINYITARNCEKVLCSFIKNKVSEADLNPTTGYGYNDRGREKIDDIYKDIFNTEAALVRHFMVSGTHALTTALFGVLRPGDILLSVADKPYDTLDEVIGIKGSGKGSLKEFNIEYRQVDLRPDGKLDYLSIEKTLKELKPKVVYLQRSRGYSTRPSITISEIGKVSEIIKKTAPESIFMVDNCYGEFVELLEPSDVGADLIVGSLIKNPGGSFAESGGYIAGKKELVEQCSYRLTSPGLGSEVGASLNQNKNILRGIYFAPSIVGEALKTAVFASALFELLGFECSPSYEEKRTDIVQQIILKKPEALIEFCGGIQSGSPIDSYVTPEAWDMPGYTSQVVMAAGAFVSGSSIELSADGPIRPPYCAYLQGGVIFESAKMGIILAAERLYSKGFLEKEKPI